MFAHFGFESAAIELAAIEFGDDGFGLGGIDINKGVAFAGVNIADAGGGEAGFTLDEADDTIGIESHLAADIEVNAGLVGWSAAAGLGLVIGLTEGSFWLHPRGFGFDGRA